MPPLDDYSAAPDYTPPPVRGDVPVLTSEDEIDRLAALYYQDAKSRQSPPPTAALSPTPRDEFSQPPEAAPEPEATSGSSTPPAPTPTPSPTVAPEAGGDYGGGGDTAPAPAPAPAPATTPAPATATPTPADDWWRKEKSPFGGNWLGPPIDLVTDQTPPEPGLGKVAAVGITRGATGAVKGAGNILGLAARQIGKMTDSEVLQHFGDGIDSVVKALDDRAQGLLPPQSLSEAYDKGQLASWMIGKSAETLTGMLPVMAAAKYAKAGVGILAAYGALDHAVQESKDPNATPASMMTAATTGAASMVGAVKGFQLTEALPLFKRIIAQAATFGGLSAAETYAAPLPKAVRGEGYEAPSGEKVLEAVLPSVAVGAAGAPFMGRAAPGRAEEKPPVEKPVTTPGAPMDQPPIPPDYKPPGEPMGPPMPMGPEMPYGPPAPQGELGIPAPRPPEYNYPPASMAPQPDLFAPRGPRGAVEQGPALSTEDPAVRAATDQAVNPPTVQGELPIPAPTPKLPPEDLFGYRPPGGEPTSPPPPPAGGRTAEAEPAPAGDAWRPVRPDEVFQPGRQFRMNVTTGQHEVLEPAAQRAGAAREAAPTEVRPPDFTTEPDHLDPNRSVAKNAAGDVVGKGASIEEALADARARGGMPYTEQAPAAEVAAATQNKSAREIVNEPGVEPPTAPSPTQIPPINLPTEQPTTVVRRAARRLREVVVGRRGEGVVSEEQPGASAPKTVGEELQQRQLARKRGEQVAEGPPKVTKATQRASLMERGVAADVEEAQQRRGPAPTRGTPVEAIGEGEAEGIEPTAGGIAETRAKTTTDKDLHYGDLLHDVLQGNKTVDEAAAAAGTKEPGTRGRPRRNKDLAEYIDKRIEQAEAHNETDRQHLDRLAQTLEADNKLTPARRQAALKKINADLEDLGLDTHSDLQTARIEKYNAETDARNAARGRSETERQHLDDLRKMRDQLRGGTTEGGPKVVNALSADEMVGLKKAHSRGIRLLNRIVAPRINAKVQARLVSDEKAGRVSSYHDYLHDIADDPYVKLVTPHLAATARRLLEILPDDIRVTSFETLGRETGHDSIRLSRANGGYYPDWDTIALRPGIKNMAEVLTHEGIHGATYKYLEHIHDKVDRYEDLTPREQKHFEALDAIEAELRSVLAATGEIPRSKLEHQQLAYAVDAAGNQLAIRGRHEILTEVLTDPRVISLLARAPASMDFRAEMQRLGFGKPTTVWQAVKGFLKDILRFKDDSVLEQVFHPLTAIVERGAAYRRQTAPPKLTLADYGVFGGSSEAPGRRGGLPTDSVPSEWARDRLRPFGEAVLNSPLNDKAAQAAERVREAAAGSGATRRTLRAVLPAMPTTAIAKSFRNVLPQATAIRDAWARTHRAADDFYTQYGNQVQDWARQLKYGKDVGGLMNEATLNRVYVTDQPNLLRERNTHLTPDEMVKAQELSDRFSQLTPEKQKLYNDVRDYYRATHDETRRLEYEDVARRALPEASEAQIQQLGEQLRTKKGIQDVINEADSETGGPMSKLFAERWENSRATVREIAKFQQQGFVEGDYFPLRRYGNYVLRYGEFGTPTYGVEMFERSSEAKDRRAELVKQFANDPNPMWHDVRISDVLSKAAQPERREFIPESVFTDMERALARRGASNEEIERVKEAYAHALLQRATHSEGAMSRARRSYVAGASEDAGRVLWNHFFATGRRNGHLIHGAEEARAFQEAERRVSAVEGATGAPGSGADIPRSAAQLAALKARPDATPEDISHAQQQHDWLVKPPSSNDAMRARTVLEELKARRAPIGGDTSDGLLGKTVGKFTKASFVYHLARPAHLALQVAEAHANAQSLLGARYGHVATTIALAKAMREVGPIAMAKGFRNMLNATRGEMQHNDWNMSDVLTQRMAASRPGNAAYGTAMKELMNVAHDYGLIDHSRAREIQRLAQPGAFEFGGETHNWTNVASNMMNLFAAGEHAVDGMNRAITLKAGFDLAMRGKDITNEAHVRQAIHEAVGFAEDAQPVYGQWNTPRVATARGPIQRDVAPAIMQYKLYGMHMYSVMGNLVRQAAYRPAERAEALKALAGLVATHSILAGATATMFGLPVVAVLGAWDMLHGKEKPHDYEVDLRRWITAVGGETVGRFASSGVLGLAGVSQQNTLKLSNMVNVPELRSFDKAGMGQFILQAMSGASGSVAQQVFQGMHDFTSGNFAKAGKELLPRVIGDPIKAYGYATQGVTDTRGRTIAPPSQIGAGSIATTALGFNPTDITLDRQRRYAEESLKNEVQYARQQAVDRYVTSGGRDMSGVRSFNANRDYSQIEPLTYKQLQDELNKNRQRGMRPQLYGMIPPKRTEQRFIRETRFQ